MNRDRDEARLVDLVAARADGLRDITTDWHFVQMVRSSARRDWRTRVSAEWAELVAAMTALEQYLAEGDESLDVD